MHAGEPTTGTPGGRDAELLRAMANRIDQSDPGAFNNLGVLYYSKGMYADAVSALLRALELDPRMRTAARNLEVAAAKPGACDARLAAINMQLQSTPGDAGAHRERARLLRLIGRTGAASQQLEALIAKDPDDGAALFERGLVEQRAGDLRRAQRWFERAVNAAPQEAVARLHLAEVLYQRGQNEQALETLDSVIAQDASLADAHLLRGFVLGDMGRHEAAMASSRLASMLNPSLQSLQPHLSLDNATASEAPAVSVVPGVDSGMARYGLGLAFRQRGYFDESRREFVRALEHGEDDRLNRHAIAELDLIAGQYTAASTAYAALLRAYPDHPRFWNEHGVALHQAGDVIGAADAYRAALRLDPHHTLAYNNLGVALSGLGDQTAARQAFVRATELDPSLVRARLNCARWFQENRHEKAALSMLRELVSFHPDDADAWHALGSVCQDLGWFEEARNAYARAIERCETHAEARYALAQVLGALGDDDGALRETQRALALAPVRVPARLNVIIDLQRECPEACGSLDLLSLRSGDPLTGVALNADDVVSLLPDHSATVLGSSPGPLAANTITVVDSVADAGQDCHEADVFAARGVHGEAIDRYARARALLEPEQEAPGAPAYAAWRRAAIGEARSACLLGRGADALPLLKRLGSHDAKNVEVLALFACSAAAAAQSVTAARPETPYVESARKAIIRSLRLEPDSAALMHFLGNTAVAIGDEGLALGCFRRALALDASRPSARVAIARLLRARGDLLAARLELVAALSSAPGWRDAMIELAEVHRAADRPQDALVLLTTHLATTPTDLDALVFLGETLVRLDRDDDARIANTRVLRHDPSHLAALFLDGMLLSRQSRIRDAVERWQRVAEHSLDHALTQKAQRALADAGADAGARAGAFGLRLVS